jgi:hypothetical protein
MEFLFDFANKLINSLFLRGLGSANSEPKPVPPSFIWHGHDRRSHGVLWGFDRSHVKPAKYRLLSLFFDWGRRSIGARGLKMVG